MTINHFYYKLQNCKETNSCSLEWNVNKEHFSFEWKTWSTSMIPVWWKYPLKTNWRVVGLLRGIFFQRHTITLWNLSINTKHSSAFCFLSIEEWFSLPVGIVTQLQKSPTWFQFADADGWWCFSFQLGIVCLRWGSRSRQMNGGHGTPGGEAREATKAAAWLLSRGQRHACGAMNSVRGQWHLDEISSQIGRWTTVDDFRLFDSLGFKPMVPITCFPPQTCFTTHGNEIDGMTFSEHLGDPPTCHSNT